MSDDLVKRLRSPANVFYEYAADDGAFLREAASRIEKLEAQLAQSQLKRWAARWEEQADRIEGLEAALREITLIENQEYGPDWDEIDLARTIARKALEGKDD